MDAGCFFCVLCVYGVCVWGGGGFSEYSEIVLQSQREPHLNSVSLLLCFPWPHWLEGTS